MKRFQVMVWNGIGYSEDIIWARSFNVRDGHLFFWGDDADCQCVAFAEDSWRSVKELEGCGRCEAV